MSFFRELRKNRYLYTLLIPGLAVIVLFSYVPMFGHLLAFKNYRFDMGIFRSPWNNFANFRFFFTSRDWKTITFNTLYLNTLFILATQVVAVIVALMITEMKNKYIKRISQSMIFLPYFVSWLVVSLMLVALLNGTDGLINKSFRLPFGLASYPFYMKPQIWPLILTVSYVWKFAGYYSVIYIASIIGISPEYYDAAKIDGATKVQQIRFITLPMIRTTVIIMLLLAIGRIFYGDFGMIYGIIGDNGILFPTTDVIDTYTYRALRQLGNFGMASAVNLFQSTLGLIMIVIFNTVVRRIEPDASLF